MLVTLYNIRKGIIKMNPLNIDGVIYQLRPFGNKKLLDWVMFVHDDDVLFVKIGKHAKERMIKRFVPSKSVLEALVYGDWKRQWRGVEENFHVTHRQVRLIMSHDIHNPAPNRLRVKTLYYDGHTLKGAKLLSRLNGTSIYDELELIRA